MFTLHWKHAWTGRLSNPQPPREHPKLKACSARLAEEMNAGTLPFLTLPFKNDLKTQIEALMPQLRTFQHMIALGIGGSALGAKALRKAFFSCQDLPNYQGPRVWFLDNVDAESLTGLMSALSPQETVVVPISKSGGTIETLAQYFILRDWLREALPESWRDHLIFVTDNKNGYLREEANQEHIATLPVPDHLGGRYSVMSAVGMLPAAFMGLPWEDLLEGAQQTIDALLTNPGRDEILAEHPAWTLANWGYELSQHGYSQLIFFSYIPAWAEFGGWFAQLWAESLGKEGKGTMPLPAVGATDQHSLQQMFLDGPTDKGCLFLTSPGQNQGPRFPEGIPARWDWLRGKPFGDLLQAEAIGTAAAMAHKKIPLVQLELAQPTLRSAGALMSLCMLSTVLTGWLLEINPLDQPAVELGKRLAYARLGADGYHDEAAMLDVFLE